MDALIAAHDELSTPSLQHCSLYRFTRISLTFCERGVSIPERIALSPPPHAYRVRLIAQMVLASM
jgi:hypothetical protein